MTSKSSNLAVKKALKFSRFSGHVTITPQGLKRDLPSLGRDTCLHLEWRDVSSSTTRYFRKETCWNHLKSNWLAGTEMVCWRQLNWKQASGMQNLLSCMKLPQWLRPNMPQASCIIFFVCFLPGLEKGGLKDIPGDLQVVLTALSLGSCLLDWKLPSRILRQSTCLRHQAVTFCQEILKAIDADGSGVIDYTEFLVSWLVWKSCMERIGGKCGKFEYRVNG